MEEVMRPEEKMGEETLTASRKKCGMPAWSAAREKLSAGPAYRSTSSTSSANPSHDAASVMAFQRTACSASATEALYVAAVVANTGSAVPSAASRRSCERAETKTKKDGQPWEQRGGANKRLASAAVCRIESKPNAATPLRNIPVRKP